VHLAYPVPLNSGAFACPIVVTLHDLYPHEIPENFGFPKAIFNRLILHQCLRQVDSIVCVSDVTRDSLSKYVSQKVLRKSLRIYNCVEPAWQEADSPIAALSGGPFLLCIAQHRRNKNLVYLVDVFSRLLHSGRVDAAMRLVIVGIPGPETARIERAIERSGIKPNVLLMEGLPEAELQWCYRNCAAVVAPSTVEGFGLPVAEALLAGCRVVCSDLPVFRELGGQSCRFVRLDGAAEEAFADAIVATLRGPRPQAALLPNLSIPVIAEQYVRLYRGLPGTVASDTEFQVLDHASHATAERQSL
jgi:glycosyltransferase involved in cell wall biosynthesis